MRCVHWTTLKLKIYKVSTGLCCVVQKLYRSYIKALQKQYSSCTVAVQLQYCSCTVAVQLQYCSCTVAVQQQYISIIEAVQQLYGSCILYSRCAKQKAPGHSLLSGPAVLCIHLCMPYICVYTAVQFLICALDASRVLQAAKTCLCLCMSLPWITKL